MIDKVVHVSALAALMTALVALAISDHKSNLLPDSITLPLIWSGLLLNIGVQIVALNDAVLGAAGGYACVRILHDFRLMLSGKAAIGLGDAKLLAALGAWFGWKMLPLLVVASALLTLAIYAGQNRMMPFGVGLSMSGTVVAAWKIFY